jgi:hypothetical protein
LNTLLLYVFDYRNYDEMNERHHLRFDTDEEGKLNPDKYHCISLDIAQVQPEQVVYVDDRAMFVEIAQSLRMNGILHTRYEMTRLALEVYGLYTPDGKMLDCKVTSPGSHRVMNKQRPLVACDTHPPDLIETAYKRWQSRND